MANINVGELIVVNVLPTQNELNLGSITVSGVTKIFTFPVVFRLLENGASASVDYTYLNAVDAPTTSFNPDLSFIQVLDIVSGELKGIKVELNMPQSITTVKSFAFFDKFLTKLKFSNNLLIIEDSAFANNQLTSLTIPNSVTTIGNGAFVNNQLTSITLPATTQYYSGSFDTGVVVTGGILIT